MNKMFRLSGLIMLGLMLALWMGGVPAEGQTPAPSKEEGVSLSLMNTKLSTLLEYLAKWEGKPLLYADNFPKDLPVNVISPANVSIPPEKFINVIESILRMKGFTIVTSGPVIKIVPSVDAKEQPTVINSPEDLNKLEWTDRIVTQVIPLKVANAAALSGLLMQLKSKEGSIIPHPETNSLIITEFAGNIRRLNDVIKQLDVEPEAFQTLTKQLKYASAVTVHTSLDFYVNTMIQNQQVRATKRPLIIHDDRTNSVIVFGLPDDLKRLEPLVDTLDMEFSKKDSALYTCKLANTNAEDVVKILDAIFTKQVQTMPAAAKKPDLSITFDKPTNSLAILAPPEMYAEMEKLIKTIDIKKTQVLIEAVIASLDMDKMVELGIELAATNNPTEKGTGFGGTQFGLSTTTTDGKVPTGTEGLTLGVWKKRVGDIPFLLQAAQKDTGIDVKAAPSLLTNDNSPATIKITEDIPYMTTVFGPDGRPTASNFGGFLTAGITLNITPHISEDGYLRLEVEQEVAQFVASAYSKTQPGKTTRNAKTVVTVPDKETVIIGGLTQDTVTKKVSKVPLLGDIPLLGALFRSTNDEMKKTNLCIFIRPRIIKQFPELKEETEKAQKSLEDEKKKNR